MSGCECPKCGKDISDSYQGAEPDVGLMSAGWYCEDCNEPVLDEGDSFDDDVHIHLDLTRQDPAIPQTDKCPSCQVPGEMSYGMAGGGLGPYMYCPSCGKVLSKSQDEG